MAKSVKQQMYEQLANQHVQQALNNIGMQQFQEAYNQWNSEQEGLANFEAQYNEWAKANPVETKPAAQQAPKSEPVVLPVLDANIIAERNKRRHDFNENYARQQQEESMLQSADKDKGQKYKDAVSAGRDILFSKEANQLKKQNAVNNLLSNGQQSKPIIGANVSQVDLSKYNLPVSNGLTDEEIKNFNDLVKAKQWTQEGYKLTKEEAKEAQRIARENIARLEKPTEKTSSPAYFGRRYEDMTPEEQAEYDLYKNLDLRSNKLKSFAVGAADKLLDYGKTILAGNAETQARKLSAEAAARNALGLNSVASPEELRQIEGETKENIQNVEEQVAPVRDLAQGAPVIAQPTLPVIGQVDITPYGAGQFTTQALAYGATNPAFDAFGAAMGGGKVAGFIANQIGQNAQDLVLDTSLVARQALEDGVITPEEEQAIQDNIRSNGIGNAFFGGLQEIPALAKFVNGKFKANNAADEAFRANVSEGAERLARLANPEDIDNVVRNATRQTEEAAQNIENLGRQIQEVMPRQIDEAYDIPERLNPVAEMEEYIPSQLDDELRAMNDEMGNMWGDTAAKTTDNVVAADDTTKNLTDMFKAEGYSDDQIKQMVKNPTEAEIERASRLSTNGNVGQSIDNAPQIDVKQVVDNPALTADTNANINDYLFPLEQPFTEKGRDAFRRVVNNITTNSEEGYNITAQYYEISDALRKTTDEATETALRGQLDDLRASAKNIDKSVRGQLKDVLDYMDAETALADYKRALNGENKEAVDAAARKLDAIRNRIARHKGADKELSSMFSGGYGTAVNRPKFAYSTPPEDIVDEDIIKDWDVDYKAQRDAIDNAPTSEALMENADDIKLGDTGRFKMNLMTFNDENNVRHGVEASDDLWNQLKAGENGAAPNQPVTPDVMPTPQGKKLSKLYSTLQNTDMLTDAEKETFKNKNGFFYDPDNEKKLGAAALEEIENGGTDNIYREYSEGTIDRPLTGSDTHRMFAASADYNRLAKEALENGQEGAANLYAAKARNLMLEARFHATSGAQFNAAIAYYARTPQGYIDKANDVLAKRLQEFSGKNPKLASDIDKMAESLSNSLKNVDVDGIMAGADEAAKSSLRAMVLNTIDSVASKGSRQAKNIFKDLSPEEIDAIISSKYQADLARSLDMFAMGSFGVKPATVDKVLDIFADAEQYNINSKEYGKLEKQAFDLLMNDLNSGKGKSFADKFDTWRYLSMLFNPLTWAKNTVGNLTNSVLTGAKNNLAAVIEEAAEHRAKAKGAEGIFGGRTKAILNSGDSPLLDACAKDFDEFSYRAYKNGGNRWLNFERDFEQAGDVFNNNTLVGKGLNKANAFNNDVMLGGMDTVAGKAKYRTSMAGFLKANGADDSIFKSTDPNDLKLLEEARTYALESANEATFHTTRGLSSAMSNWIREGKASADPAYRVAARMLDFTIPFIKTPGNILRACVDYSPLKFIQVMSETGKWQKGEIKTAKYIDDISKALTGTGLMVLGGVLREMGFLDVSSGDSELDTYNKKKGLTNASLPSLGGRRLSIAALAPGAMPIIWGGQAWDAIKKTYKGDKSAALDVFYNGLGTMGDTLTDMTMLSGLSDMIESIRYSGSKGEAITKVATQVGTNLTSQLLPTLGRKIEQTVDDTARSTYSAQQSNVLKTLDSNRKYLTSKIPFSQELGETLEKSDNQVVQGIGDFLTNEPSVSGWGEEIKNQDYGLGMPGRLVHNTVDIFNTNDVNATERDDYLKDVYQKGGKEPKVLQFGYVTQSDANIDNYRMTEKEWTQYQKDSGVIRGQLLDAAMGNEDLKGQTKTDQAAIISSLKDFAKKYTQYKVCGENAEMKLSSENQNLMKIYEDAGGGEAGAKAVIDNMIIRKTLGDAGYSYKEGSAAAEAVKTMDAEEREEFTKTAQTLSDYGLTSYSSQATWDKAQKAIPGITIDEFAKTYNDIDSMGKKNQAIAQGELIDYLQKNNMSQSEGTKVWNAYGSSSWVYVPVLEKGVWKKKKK